MRYFDQGILIGEKHPITKLRSVDKASVLALMKKYGMKWEEQIEFQGKSDSLERTDAATQKAENDAKKLSPHCG
jgi:hypothetical protein